MGALCSEEPKYSSSALCPIDMLAATDCFPRVGGSVQRCHGKSTVRLEMHGAPSKNAWSLNNPARCSQHSIVIRKMFGGIFLEHSAVATHTKTYVVNYSESCCLCPPAYSHELYLTICSLLRYSNMAMRNRCLFLREKHPTSL